MERTTAGNYYIQYMQELKDFPGITYAWCIYTRDTIVGDTMYIQMQLGSRWAEPLTLPKNWIAIA